MFTFAFLVGIYSYLIVFFGIQGWLYRDAVLWLTVLFWGSFLGWRIKKIRWNKRIRLFENKPLCLLVILLSLQTVVNLIGVFGPELGFDALWYHLTLPKLYLQHHSVFFIPGGLLYYSAMPKLAEVLYIAGISFGNETIAKCIHFLFSLLTCLAIYKLSRKFFSPLISLIAVVIFSANLVVGWESISAYIDLIRTFFEVMALWAFINWVEMKKQKWLVWSAVMMGLAITTKVLAIGSLLIFIILILVGIREKRWIMRMKDGGVFALIAFIVPLPWFVFSYIHTGNPVYPFFSEIYPVSPSEINIFSFLKEVWILFTQAADPISPVYLMFLPFIVLLFIKSKNKFGVTSLRIIGLYSLLSIIVWYFTPRTGGGRFIIPYLPAFSLLCASIVSEVLENKKRYNSYLGEFLLGVIIFVSVFSIGYRFVANKKYIPVILGKQTKAAFLSSHLNFSYGDFYDTDGYFKTHIKPTDTVLLFGFHNLYYVDFPSIDASWLQPGDYFNYIATQKTDLPKQYGNWVLIYENERTMVKLYKMPEHLYSFK